MMDSRDRAAMTAAIEMARAEGEPIDAMLRTRSWEEVAVFAVGVCQARTLKLKPWECAPYATVDAPAREVYGHRPSEIQLRERMKRAGISIYHPNPLPELERIERERAA